MGRKMGEVRQAKSSLPPFLAYSMCLRLDFDKGAACHAKTAAIYCLLSSTIFRKYFTIYEFLLCLVPLSSPCLSLPLILPPFVLFMLLHLTLLMNYWPQQMAASAAASSLPEDIKSFLPKLG